MAIAQTFTFGPGNAYTASWDGVSTLTITLTSGGAFVASLAGQNLAQVTAAPEFQQLAQGSLAPVLPVALALQAATPVAGYGLVNSIGNVITWAAPNDGQLHRFMAIVTLDVTVATTGGQIQVNCTLPDGSNGSQQVIAPTQATGVKENSLLAIVQAGATVAVRQNSAMSAGTATLWAEIWGA